MRITVLTHTDSENAKASEYDEVVPQVARALRRLGHRVSVFGIHTDVRRFLAGACANGAVGVLIEKPDPSQGNMLVGHNGFDYLPED